MILENLNAVVTGSSSGIGKEIAFHLAETGLNVILGGRNPKKIQETDRELKEKFSDKNVEVITADLSDFQGVKEFSEKVKARFKRLDILINNAGAFFPIHSYNSEGIENTFALNHLGYFRLTGLLLPLLQKSSAARIINTSSNAHKKAKLDLNDLNLEKSYNGWKAYSRSKLANILFTRELSRRLEKSSITVNAFHPGVIATDIVRMLPFPVPQLYRFYAGTVKDGAEGGIFLALDESVKNTTGLYFKGKNFHTVSREAADPATAANLWECSEKFQELKWAY